MLRVSIIQNAGAIALKLEGKLFRPWCDEFQRVIRQLDQASPLALDLYDVSYVDPRGTDLIRTLIAQGARVTRSSNFVAELLKQECI